MQATSELDPEDAVTVAATSSALLTQLHAIGGWVDLEPRGPFDE